MATIIKEDQICIVQFIVDPAIFAGVVILPERISAVEVPNNQPAFGDVGKPSERPVSLGGIIVENCDLLIVICSDRGGDPISLLQLAGKHLEACNCPDGHIRSHLDVALVICLCVGRVMVSWDDWKFVGLGPQ